MIKYIYTLSDQINNNTFYVGSTSDIETRFSQHKNLSSYYPSVLYKYIRDENILINMDIIDVVDGDIEHILKIEAYWIQQFVTWGFDLKNTAHKKTCKKILSNAVNITISKETYKSLKDYCNTYGLKIGKFGEDIIREKIKKEKLFIEKNTSTTPHE